MKVLFSTPDEQIQVKFIQKICARVTLQLPNLETNIWTTSGTLRDLIYLKWWE